ncbi:MAG: FecR domain-containing protein [SAR324 cluster bacterium]|nr:FecR domain-containing protein [SAR324 cluster bacterium]
MRLLKNISCLISLLICETCFLFHAWAADPVVASLVQTTGFVEIVLARAQKNETGKDGILLHVGDVVRTGRNGATTVVFRGGSQTRIFENSELKIEGSEELSSEYSYKFNEENLAQLKNEGVPGEVINKLNSIKGKLFKNENTFLFAIEQRIGKQETNRLKGLILVRATKFAEERTFRHRLKLVAGAIWGRFVRGRQQTQIYSSTATIGVKGTVFRLKDDGQEAKISVVEGEVSVKNDQSFIVLKAGQRLQAFTKTDQLKEKLVTIPYRLSLQASNYQLDFDELQESKFRFHIQIVDVLHGNNVGLSGKIYLESNYYNIQFPEQVILNQSGSVRVPVQIRRPHPSDRKFDGKIVIWAVMDGANYDEVGEGHIFLNVKMPGKRKEIMIDADGRIIDPSE